ncbi:3-isopropylmalate dehydrogenase [Anaerosphaera multitolerans]|uniref:3-isopropylmalate dehydrogenase n=1 Tax=Anaerosphaera multitolerans TaxID=2487351 RepID=A0A437S6G7_9FIRM|nr:3-isopropylmalate dehydrogenase [Anaerosphaera multitolerans]RVU54603.1 3-isopropylmalate dehydrogenase [Anaerosphaera multitolerans]
MKKIAILKGDGIGPEIIDCAIEVMDKIQEVSKVDFEYSYGKIGGDAIDNFGDPYPKETEAICKSANAVLLGAVGGEKWDNIESEKRPEKGLLRLRKSLGVFANLRPCKIYDSLKDNSPLKPEYIKDVDILIVRELMGGIYFGNRGTVVEKGLKTAFDEERYNEEEIERIARYAFEMSLLRKQKVTLVDKANVMDSSKLWREVVKKVAEGYKEVALDFMYVDNAAMQLVRNPAYFDCILTNNIFGDILSDEASQISGSIGLLPSASLGEKMGLYEPIHGSAPDIAGKNLANPLATILSCALMLRYSFKMDYEAKIIERAVEDVLEEGFRTFDLDSKNYLGTREITREVVKRIK